MLVASQALHEHLKSEVQRYILQAAICDEALSCLLTPGRHESLQFGAYFASLRIMNSTGESSESLRKGKGHIPLLLRVTERKSNWFKSYSYCGNLCSRMCMENTLFLNI